MTENVKKFDVLDCTSPMEKICVLSRFMGIKVSHCEFLFHLSQRQKINCRALRIFQKDPDISSWIWTNRYYQKLNHLRGKLTDEQLEAIKDVLERSQDVFTRHMREKLCFNFLEHEID